MNVYQSVLETIGHTPLIRLGKLSDRTGKEILAKVEYFNPGGSVKDRIAVRMLERAESDGLINPDTTIIEATAGNTGVGLAIVAAIKGWKTIFVLPDKMSSEKIALLKAYGAAIVITPTNVPPNDPRSYNSVADRLSLEIENSWRPGQFSNMANPEAHYLTTGPEIWNDTDGAVDVFVAGVGTGGTVTGVGRALREKKKDIKIVVADPEGSILSGGEPGSWKVEGIGEDFFPETFDSTLVNEYVRVSDAESFAAARMLARQEGLLVGGSAGTALAAVVKYAAGSTTRETIVVLLPDTGRNYLSKFFSDEWLEDNGFMAEVTRLAV
ncbi:MAG: pyridoxal-phosphate dependent enzyme [Actinomycetota bacterium]